MRRAYYAAAVLVIVFTAGCAHYGALGEDYGKSFNTAKYGQILNPGASKNLAPVTGLDGMATEAVMKKYVDSFSRGGEQSAQQSNPQTPVNTPGTDTYGKQ